MTEYDPLAEEIYMSYVDTSSDGGSYCSVWQRPDWQAAAEAAREFIAAEDDGWVEVSGPEQISKGDEVRVILVEDGLELTTKGVAHHQDRDGDWAVDQGGVLTNVYNSDDQTIYVRCVKQEPPTAPLIVAYELEGKWGYPDGIAMVKVLTGDQKGMYAPVEDHTTATLFWHPKRILRYDVAKAVVDG